MKLSAKQVEQAIDEYGENEDNESFFHEALDSYNSDPVFLTIDNEQVEVKSVEYEGGTEGAGEYCFAVFSVGDQLFKKEGYYASHYGTDWDGDLFEVKPAEKTITVYNRV